MACAFPRPGFQGPADRDGVRRVFFHTGPNGGLEHRRVLIACKQCLGCKSAKRNEWALRAWHESLMWPISSFVTLTYKDPAPPTLVRRHVDLWLKLHRKHLGPVRYLLSGEYGGETYRPHYHAILYGYWPVDATWYSNSATGTLYTSDLYHKKIWKRGRATFAYNTPASCAYVAGYTLKKQASIEAYVGVNPTTGEQVKEFRTSSLKPALGDTYALHYKANYATDDLVDLRTPTPKRYITLMETQDPALAADLKAKRSASAAEAVRTHNPRQALDGERIRLARLNLTPRKGPKQ